MRAGSLEKISFSMMKTAEYQIQKLFQVTESDSNFIETPHYIYQTDMVKGTFSEITHFGI